MKTNVHAFCEAFSRELDPFAKELRESIAALPQPREIDSFDTVALGLQEIQQRLSTLQEKVSGQRTFLLIFGPLKSGKSTLMNALSGAYVSEVSSLPAYPALVYVKNGEQRRFEATDYEGGKQVFEDNVAMTRAVHQDHARLAESIVEAERAGEDFDPRRHYPSAIRRMDIELPAGNLAESGSVLVDTPGLYSRMKFGYDQMTRDFRDTAACAIFVVKTDNLFFEKVFEEFEELLSCFSRIFLVSNIDSSKQDLRPDGSLEASLESREPEKIIDAFRSLSMSATLREALEDGRLRIYPIDLLKAASKSLREASGGSAEAAPDQDGPDTGWGDGFDEFVSDLTSYLNSSDYLHDFMYDSVRLARDLSAEAGGLVSGDVAGELSSSNQRLQQELQADRKRLQALEKLARYDWSSAFGPLREEKDRLLSELSGEYAEQLEEACQEQVSAWMESDESWNALIDERLNPRLQRETANRAQLLLERLRSHMGDKHGGARLPKEQLDASREAGLQIDSVLAGSLQKLGSGSEPGSLRLDIDAEDIPLRRTFADYLLLRSRARIGMQLFGEAGEKSIDPAAKQSRLGGAGLDKLRETIRETIEGELPELLQRYADGLLDTHIAECSSALKKNVDELRNRLQNDVAERQKTLQTRQQAQEVFERIQSTAVRFDRELGNIRSQFELEEGTHRYEAIPETAY